MVKLWVLILASLIASSAFADSIGSGLTSRSGFSLSGGNVFTSNPNANVGIGSSNPSCRVDLASGGQYCVRGVPISSGGGGGTSPAATFTVCSSTTSLTCNYTATGTNDNVVINTAIAAANALTDGGKVLLSDGTFNISSNILPLPNVDLGGMGNSTILAGQSGLTGLAIIDDLGTTYTASSMLTNWSVHDMKIDGTSMPRGSYSVSEKGIGTKYSQNVKYYNLWVYNTPATCIGTDYIHDGFYHHNLVDTCGTAAQGDDHGSNGIGIGVIGNSSTGFGTNEPIIISNNIAKSVANKSIMVEMQTSGVANGGSIVIADNIVHSGKFGITTSGVSNLSIHGNIAYGMSSNCFDSKILVQSANDNIWANNIAHDCTGEGFSIVDTAGFRDIVESNEARGNTLRGFYFDISRLEAVNNISANNQLEGMKIDATGNISNIRLRGNHIVNNGMAATSGKQAGIEFAVASGDTVDAVDLSDNRIYDTQGTPTQKYGIDVNNAGTITNFTMKNNDLRGNGTAAFNQSAGSLTLGTNFFPFGNRGYISNYIENDTMSILGGNLGIGTATPEATLDVFGGAHFTGNIGGDQDINVGRNVNVTNDLNVFTGALNVDSGGASIGGGLNSDTLINSGFFSSDIGNFSSDGNGDVTTQNLHAIGHVNFDGDFEDSGTPNFEITESLSRVFSTQGIATLIGDVDAGFGGALMNVSYSVNTIADDFAVTGNGGAYVDIFIPQNTPNVGIGTTNPQGGLVVMSGNVGIGTWKPNALLNINGGNVSIGTQIASQALTVASNANNGAGILFTTPNGWSAGKDVSLFLGDTNHGIKVPYSSSDVWTTFYGMQFSDSQFSSTIMTIGSASDTNVGIGTTIPVNKLDVRGNTTLAGQTYGSTAGETLNLLVDNGSTAVSTNGRLGSLQFGGRNSSTAILPNAASIQAFVNNATDWTSGKPSSYMTLSTTQTGSTSPTERIRIDSVGNIGIGTTNPGQLLDVKGNIRISTLGSTLAVASGTNGCMGQSTLSSGTVTVTTTCTPTSSLGIFLTDAQSSLTNVGSVTIATVTAGTSFVIQSTNILDSSNVNWWVQKTS